MGRARRRLPPANLDWLGLGDERRFEADRIARWTCSGDLMFEKLAFRPGERDMIVLYHDFQRRLPGRPRGAHHLDA